ncbi:MAG: imidazolonepropionase [Herpetosiphonaceae bacterium]|nr:MAG: imidazolonepropionase [Herpetosiphonaceae bacterium]
MEREPADLLITHVGRLITCAAADGPKRGAAQHEIEAIHDAAIAVGSGRILAVGLTEALDGRFAPARRIDAAGGLVTPGFVDPHTHACYAGDRADEFELRIAGATYQQIMAAGGGIMRTVRATRAASVEQLVAETRPRLDRMLAHGTTTVEIKTGYGLTTEDELKMLDALARLDAGHPISIVPTFLGAHAIPAEYRDNPDAYVDMVVDEMLPAVARWRDAHPGAPVPRFCDVFCETGAFSLEQSRRILERARELGFELKIHVDEFDPLGGTPLAVELGAVSADHLVATPSEHVALLARSATVAIALPGTPFGLGHYHFTPGRAIIDAGGALALATDCNPGTSVCESIPLMIALACRAMRITPAEALHAATINAAYGIGMGHEIGSLQPGKRADLLIHDVPSETHLAYRFGSNPVKMVIKDGRVVWERGALP